ncbi:MAG: uroporphyrinogen decarboxylase family protein [Bryobacteraceae bacterium]
MRIEQWQAFKAAAQGARAARVPVALLVDSPWFPGYAGITHLEYFLDAEAWFQTNLRFAREFPDAIPFPSWWVEYGMGTEPSAIGARLRFYADKTPDVSPVLFRPEDIDQFTPVNPSTDGLMPFVLHLYRTLKQRIFDAGFTVPVVAARGPLCLAAFVRGINEFMMDLAESPEAAHRLIRFSTETVIRWLGAQAEAIGSSVEGILVLDDIVGMLSRRMYREFAHPYLKQICDAFPPDWVKVYHNDANVKPFLGDLPDTGFGVLNFSHNVGVAAAHAATGGRMCLMGNVAPLDLGVRGSADEVKESALRVLRDTDGCGVILSMGGGVSPGTPGENLRALCAAVQDYERDVLPHPAQV